MTHYKTILSASRMCDMPGYYPGDIIRETNIRLDKGIKAHTLVLWTKHPASLFAEPLYSFLNDLKARGVQLFIQLTITGMGGAVIGETKSGGWKIEPHAPDYNESLSLLSDVADLTGSANRIKIRIDPIIKVRDYNGRQYSNLSMFETIAKSACACGINNFSFSFLEPGVHAKVDRRFKNIGCEIMSFSEEERSSSSAFFTDFTKANDVIISACCVKGFTDSACIDGKLLGALHPAGEKCSLSEPRRRPGCGCVKSIDLGGWPVKLCGTGCDYCYANPVYCG